MAEFLALLFVVAFFAIMLYIERYNKSKPSEGIGLKKDISRKCFRQIRFLTSSLQPDQQKSTLEHAYWDLLEYEKSFSPNVDIPFLNALFTNKYDEETLTSCFSYCFILNHRSYPLNTDDIGIKMLTIYYEEIAKELSSLYDYCILNNIPFPEIFIEYFGVGYCLEKQSKYYKK